MAATETTATTEAPISAKEVGALLNYHPNHVRALADEGKIPAYKIGGTHYVFYKSEIMEYLQSFRIKPQAA